MAAGRDERESGFVLVGGTPALDLVATFGRRHAAGVERIPDPEALGRWSVAAGLAATAPAVTGPELDRARRLREAIAVLVRASMAGSTGTDRARAGAVRLVNELAHRPDLPPQLILDEQGRLAVAPATGGVDAVLAGIARDAVRLLGGPRAARIKECEHPDCSLVFLDETQSGRRRWCSMERCGNQVKTAGYRARRR